MKIHGFEVKNNNELTKYLMNVPGDDIKIKDVVGDEIFFKNILSLKKLNIVFLDQILTLDGKNMLIFKEIFNKKYNQFGSHNKSLVKKSWEELENKILINSESGRKIKKEIYDIVSHDLAKNLKGTDIKSVATDPLSWKSFVAVVGGNLKIIYGKKYNTMNGWIIMKHFEVLSNPTDMSIIMRKCEGCALNEKDKLSNEYLYKKSSCLLASRADRTFYLENIKCSKSILMKSNESYIITDFIQEHFEGFLTHDNIYFNNPSLHGWDDVRLISNNLKAETFAFLIMLIIGYNVENVEIMTDSEVVYNRYYNIVKEESMYGARKILKEENNIYIWALIRQLVTKDKINLPTLIKVKAHADNVYHNLLDGKIKEKYRDLKELFQLFREETYGLLREDMNNLTFIDIIKGIFPLDITRFLINNKVKADDRIALSVLFLDYVYDETFKIWEDRCEVQIKKEKAFQISKAKKKSMKSYDPEYKNRLDELTTPLYGRAEGLLAGIYFNKKPLDFTIFIFSLVLLFR
ncbi:unnamed protein product [Rhizophagus irregularis]|nr:unnamed protein product [Rhizophagus irregularis]